FSDRGRTDHDGPSTPRAAQRPPTKITRRSRCRGAYADRLGRAAALAGWQILPCRAQIELYRQDDHRYAGVLQPSLDEERRLVVKQSIVRRVFLEDDLTGHDEALREATDEIGRQALRLDGYLGAHGIRARRLEPEHRAELFVLGEVLLRALLQRFDLRRTLERIRVHDGD